MNFNAQLFNQFINEKDFYMEGFEADTYYYFEAEQSFESARVRVIASFNNNNERVDCYIFNYVTISNPSRKNYIYDLINQLNTKYTFAKFTIDENNNVNISASIPFDNNFDPQIIFNMLIMLYQSAKEEYPNLMRVLWS